MTEMRLCIRSWGMPHRMCVPCLCPTPAVAWLGEMAFYLLHSCTGSCPLASVSKVFPLFPPVEVSKQPSAFVQVPVLPLG